MSKNNQYLELATEVFNNPSNNNIKETIKILESRIEEHKKEHMSDLKSEVDLSASKLLQTFNTKSIVGHIEAANYIGSGELYDKILKETDFNNKWKAKAKEGCVFPKIEYIGQLCGEDESFKR